MRKLPPLAELRAFEAVARCLSFKLAARELGVTPTAVSHQIRLLEAYCGRSLFRRQPRPIVLTQTGEQLFPVIRDGLDHFAKAIDSVRVSGSSARMRVTATNAFAARWLMPRLPQWRKSHPRMKLEIIGTDEVLNLKNGESDISIRYARNAPVEGSSSELLRDKFYVVAAPGLVGKLRKFLTPVELTQFPLIEAGWPAHDAQAPTWSRWESVARKRHKRVPDLSLFTSLNFREELHAIEAAIAGQGVAICSNVLIAPELASGALVKVANVTLPGYGFYLVYRPNHPKLSSIQAFAAWIMTVR
jgi:LysR family glycine cleavage system transcriptional activator